VRRVAWRAERRSDWPWWGPRRPKPAPSCSRPNGWRNPGRQPGCATPPRVWVSLSRRRSASSGVTSRRAGSSSQPRSESGRASSDAASILARARADRGHADGGPALLNSAPAAPGLFIARTDARQWLDRLMMASSKKSRPRADDHREPAMHGVATLVQAKVSGTVFLIRQRCQSGKGVRNRFPDCSPDDLPDIAHGHSASSGVRTCPREGASPRRSCRRASANSRPLPDAGFDRLGGMVLNESLQWGKGTCDVGGCGRSWPRRGSTMQPGATPRGRGDHPKKSPERARPPGGGLRVCRPFRAPWAGALPVPGRCPGLMC
jgi:hypothetical protein